MQQRPLRERSWPYGAWFVLLVGAETAAYAIDPFLFGVAMPWLGGATGLVAVCGLLSCALATSPRPVPAALWSLASLAAGAAGFVLLFLISWRC
jgi:hypothetical protein